MRVGGDARRAAIKRRLLEQSEKPPRSDLLTAMAEAFDVDVVELFGENGERAAQQKKGRVSGRVRQVFDDFSKLPRRQAKAKEALHQIWMAEWSR